MERDALIAHGTSFLLQDRLMNCSDYSTAWVCRTCGSLISLGYEDTNSGEVHPSHPSAFTTSSGPNGEYCRICRGNDEAQNRDRSKSHGVKMAIPQENLITRGHKQGDLDVVAVPFVFRYLCAELASMGIAISLEIQ